MKKKSLLGLFCLIITFIMLFPLKNVNADYTWESGGIWDKDRKEYKTTYCKFTISPMDIRVRISLDGKEKIGTIYKHSDGNGDFFCLNPGKGGRSIYNMNAEHRVGEYPYAKYGNFWYINTQKSIVRIYKWYLDNRATNSDAFIYAQAAIWYVAENNITNIDGDTLKNVIEDTYMTYNCESQERRIRTVLKNKDFSCKCFKSSAAEKSFSNNCKTKFTEDEIRNKVASADKADAKDGIMTKENSYVGSDDKYHLLTLADYKEKYPSKIADSKIDSIVSEIVNNVRNYSGYATYIYFFEPISDPNNNQILVGLWGCKTGKNNCDSDIKKLTTEDFTNVTSRNRNNSNYWSQLTKIQQKYTSAIPSWKLEIDEFVANPYCGKSCQTDVDFYNSLKNSGSPNADKFWEKIAPLYNLTDKNNPTCSEITCEEEVEKYKQLKITDPTAAIQKFEFIKMTFGDQFNKNADDPKCEPSDNYKCDYEFSKSLCTFDSVITGFDIKDTQVEACWKTYDVAYNSDTLEEKSKWQEASNEFCDVYCYEEFKSELPGGITNIKAGQQFFWGLDQQNGYFGNITAKRKCYTTGIKYDDFYSEFIKNEIYIIQIYNKIVAKRLFNLQTPVASGECDLARHDVCIDKPTEIGHESSCSNPCDSATLAFCNACGSVKPEERSSACGNCGNIRGNCCGGYSEGTTTRYAGDCDACQAGFDFSGGECYEKGTYCKRDAKSYVSNETLAAWYGQSSDNIKGTQDEIKKCYAKGTDCGSDSVKGALTVSITYEETELQKALLKRKELITKITSCQSNEFVNGNNIYNYQTKVVLTYQDPTDTSKNRNISGDVAFKVTPSRQFSMTAGTLYGQVLLGCARLYSDNNQNDVEDVNTELYRCNGDYSITIPKYSDYTWDFDGKWDYYYDSELFTWKYLKENGLTYNTRTYNEKYTDFYSHNGTYGFVTAWSLVTGFYTFGEVKVNVFGNYYHGKGHFDDLFKEQNNGDDTYTYSCPFHIENEFYGSECRFDCDFYTKECKVTADSPEYCDDEVGGIDVVYRVIELNKDIKVSFPGIVGTGRNPGYNWSTFISERVEKFNNIMNYKNIYNKEPIYSIDLTTGLIQDIRKDNEKYRQNKKDPYTSMRYTDNTKKIVCDGNAPKDQTCASKWLTKLSEKGILKGIYGSIKDTDDRLAKIRTDKASNAASGGKAVAGGA